MPVLFKVTKNLMSLEGAGWHEDLTVRTHGRSVLVLNVLFQLRLGADRLATDFAFDLCV